MNLKSTCLATALIFSIALATHADEPTKVQAPMGVMVGEVTSSSAVVQLRLASTDKLTKGDVPGAAGVVEFSLSTGGDEPMVLRADATKEHDFIARVQFTDLKPGTKYVCKTAIGHGEDLSAGPSASFRTNPGKDNAFATSFVVVTGMNYAKFHGDDRIDREIHKVQNNTELPAPYTGKDKNLGYPGLASILKTKPNFFVGTGDNVYYDTPKEPHAETNDEMRQKWHEQFVQPRYAKLFAEVPTYWMIDDHDFRVDDSDNSGDYKPTPAQGRQLMLEQLPLAPHEAADVKTYRTHRISRDLQVWFPENRMYRSPNKMKDGPEKTIWGEEQKAWLKKTLLASDAKYKLLISPTPMIGPDDARKTDNHTNLGGFRYERDEFFAWLKENGLDKKHFYIVCGDRHWQYHALHPTGIEEFSCGALVDANSRLGRKPGDPKSTDPKGLIKQLYAQKERSAGFLHIQVADDLTFTWFDEHGEKLHSHTK